MSQLRRVLALGVLLGALHIGAACAAAPAEPSAVLLRGSQNLVPMVQQVAEKYMATHPNVRIIVSGGGTYRGYNSLLDGTADIAMASSPPSDEALNLRSKDSPKFITTTVGQIAMVAIVHPSNSLRDLNMAQLRGIFSGRIDNLKELGGRDTPLAVLIGPPTDGLTESWRTLVIGETAHYAPKAAILPANERLKRASADAGAITFVSAGDLNGSVKALSVNGVDASEEAVRAESYELVAPLMFVTTENTPAVAKEFVTYFQSVSKDLRFPGFIATRPGAKP